MPSLLLCVLATTVSLRDVAIRIPLEFCDIDGVNKGERIANQCAHWFAMTLLFLQMYLRQGQMCANKRFSVLHENN